ncbi:hypothetical protein K488DRAFT_82845 [Vararia minispora EC-137]|uniref:Uncharacterized protein n=1 Tax=Vararia minispora EC-137 TaxID=1314806 RepID=A0ACB8QVG9_9AGAM|nr:hypothetical protein K488DRAFT_82845 [Vararia minispora EC-137]
MDDEAKQLVEMGATLAQARAALKKYKDVMQAAERIFDGSFDDVVDEAGSDVRMTDVVGSEFSAGRLATPEDDEDWPETTGDSDEEADDDEYIDYDSDYEVKQDTAKSQTNTDPYAGIFFSKDRREEVIEVEEEPEAIYLPKADETVKLMTQGQWMKGCPEGGEQSFLFSLYTQLSEGRCQCPNECGWSIGRRKSDFFSVYSSFPKYIAQLRGLVRQKCEKCSKEFCLACGEPFNASKTQSERDVDDLDLFHCSNLQGVILGIGLAMLEQLYHDQTQHLVDVDGRGNKRRQPEPVHNSSTPDDDDDSYPPLPVQKKKLKVGTGYAGDVREDTSGHSEAMALQKSKDQRLGDLMTAIRVFLPNLHREGGGRTSDYLVHPTALAHLRRRFNSICTSLLRNDSLADMSDRSAVYFELFEWLETISNHEALASMMAMPIMVIASAKLNPPKKTPNGFTTRERVIVYEGSSGPRELMEAMVIQANAAIKGLEGVARAAEQQETEMTEEQKRVTNETKGKGKERVIPVLSEENQKLLSFCRRILKTANAIDRSLRETKGDMFVERLHASLPKLSSSGNEAYLDSDATDETTQKTYLEWATRVRFEYCDLTIPPEDSKPLNIDEPPNYKFYFNNEARMLATSDIPKRSLAIAKELAVLTTNLPVAWDSSIFLRVDETRVDVIKALIIGPEGTPYQNGCYLFDIFLGHAYNQSPPNVKYMTTNGGKYRFNPNLYADGKVCLSLLGTWSGPGWVAGRSTLLQVLISIQSMILCDEPYLNEPGWQNSAGTPQSLAYSANVRRMVVRTAMLGNLQNPPEPFSDVIRTHFRLKAKSISRQLDQWLAQDDGKSILPDGALASRNSAGASSTFKADIDELKKLMKQLQTDSGAPTSS